MVKVWIMSLVCSKDDLMKEIMFFIGCSDGVIVCVIGDVIVA